jgi:ABC-type uncharacterized transport system permease subunit
MLVGGAIAGVAGMIEVSTTFGRLRQGISPGYGFMGIAIAALAGTSLIWTIVVAFLFGGFVVGGLALQAEGVPQAFVLLVQGIILFCALAGTRLARVRISTLRPRRLQLRAERRRSPHHPDHSFLTAAVGAGAALSCGTGEPSPSVASSTRRGMMPPAQRLAAMDVCRSCRACSPPSRSARVSPVSTPSPSPSARTRSSAGWDHDRRHGARGDHRTPVVGVPLRHLPGDPVPLSLDPEFGRSFEQHALVYVGYLIAPAVWLVLTRTRWATCAP